MKDLRQRLSDEANTLIADGNPSDSLFVFFASLVKRAAATRTVVELPARTGVDVQPDAPIRASEDALRQLLVRAQDFGAVRPEIRTTEVVALLTAACHGALHGNWSDDLRHRTLADHVRGPAPRASAVTRCIADRRTSARNTSVPWMTPTATISPRSEQRPRDDRRSDGGAAGARTRRTHWCAP